jgi:hypothetical protein
MVGMKNLERIWLLVLGIAVAVAIAVAALALPAKTASVNTGTDQKSIHLNKPDPSVLLKKAIETILITLPAR